MTGTACKILGGGLCSPAWGRGAGFASDRSWLGRSGHECVRVKVRGGKPRVGSWTLRAGGRS